MVGRSVGGCCANTGAAAAATASVTRLTQRICPDYTGVRQRTCNLLTAAGTMLRRGGRMDRRAWLTLIGGALAGASLDAQPGNARLAEAVADAERAFAAAMAKRDLAAFASH